MVAMSDVLAEYIEKYSNWGRWGADDELGALNFVGPEQVKAAASLVTDGKVISLSLPYDANGPQIGGGRTNPQLFMTMTGSDAASGRQDRLRRGGGDAKGFGYADDYIVMPNQCDTQWDAFAHIFYNGKMYNNRDASEVDSRGAHSNGIQNFTGKIVMRGVLLDIPKLTGRVAMDPGEAVTPAMLDDACAAEGVQIRTGDAVLVRTGHLGVRRHEWKDYAGGASPGMSLHTAPWLHEHEVAAIVTDTWGMEVKPNEIDVYQPLHIVALTYMGIPIGEIFDLEALAEDCAADGRYDFMFSASPLPITGAVGSALSALAIK